MKRLTLLLVIGIAIAVAVSVGRDSDPEPQAQNNPPATPDAGTEAEEASIDIFPAVIRQGEPAMAVVNSTSTVTSLTWNGKQIDTFMHEGKPTAFIGLDLKMTAGSYPLAAALQNGQTIRKNLVVTERERISAPLGIPDKLGGNTSQAEQQLVSTLAQENATLAAVGTVKEKLWDEDFQYPLSNPIVTDHYGYTRLTGASTISHKGTDFRAAVGTDVYAMNSGTVKLVREFRNYGKTIIVDHGHGLQTLYMHLFETNVEEGETVDKGELIGKSGMTGYAEQPHLHLSLRINGISIDPVKFLDLF